MASNSTPTPGSAPPAPDGVGKALFAQVNTAYQDVWKACPYTSFAMFDYLIKGPPGHAYGLGSWEKFLRKQTRPTLETIGLTDTEVASPIPDWLWNGKSGLCTSFAKRVTSEVQQAGTFTFGDTTEHRAAWSRQDPWAVLVDSSARKAIYFQNVAQEESSTYGGKKKKTVSWRWVQQNLQTRTVTNGAPSRDYVDLTPIPHTEDPLVRCLRQLLPQSDMILMFRDFNESTKVATFFGKLTWDFATHSCEFSGELQDNKAYSAKVIFASSDDEADEGKAYLAFLQWLDQPLPGTRISRKDQFADVDDIHEELWRAATDVWGPPVLSVKVNERPVTVRKNPRGNAPGQKSGSQAVKGRGGANKFSSKTQARNTAGTPSGGFMSQAVMPAVGSILHGVLTAR